MNKALVSLFLLARATWFDVGDRKIEVLKDDLIRVFTPSSSDVQPGINYMVDPSASFPDVKVDATPNSLKTSKASVEWDPQSKQISISSVDGISLQEKAHSFTSVTDFDGEKTHASEQTWLLDTNAGLYGGGEFQNQFVNYRHAPLNLIQFNTEAPVPFFLSTTGFGLLWHSYARTQLNPADFEVPLTPIKKVSTKQTYSKLAWDRGAKTPLDMTAYQGLVTINVTGSYSFNIFTGMQFGGHGYKFEIDGRTVTDFSYSNNVPNEMAQPPVQLQKGHTYNITITTGTPAYSLKLFGRLPNHDDFTLRSDIGDAVDYYVMLGGSFDRSVALYRELTGAAPMYAKWAYGFWQCREHYASQQELLDAGAAFRSRSLPVDNIVQDWQYWGKLKWGPHWDLRDGMYPDPETLVKSLHGENLQLMVSVWSKFDEATEFYNEMKMHKKIINQSTYYDPTDADARALFYNYINISMFSIGVDAIWADATEPEGLPNMNQPLSVGSGNRFMNMYSLLTTTAIFDGFARDYPDKRLFVLTRSSFVGQQRTMAALWSGDTTATWDTYRRQITASVNYAASGIPYWSQDIGGFFRPGDQYDSADYRELLTRWFQFGAFTPIFRIHGGGSHTEYWNYGNDTERNMNVTNNLRYRLLPYIYSVAYNVTLNGYTMQRHLAFDFPDDPHVFNIGEEFMFGPHFLVAPIFTPGGKRSVYLPNATWYEFFTGSRVSGPATVPAACGLADFPLYVRAGAIIPMGPLKQFYSDGDRPTHKTLEVRIYQGADGQFTIFDDDGVSNDYKQGKYTAVLLQYNDAKGWITVSTDAHLVSYIFQFVLVAPDHGAGVAPVQDWDIILGFNGSRSCITVAGENCPEESEQEL